MYIIIYVISLFLIYILILYIENYKNKDYKEKRDEITKELRLKYFESLKGNDKKEALDYGRLYYASMRENGHLTIYDETALANDINTMEMNFKKEDENIVEDKVELLLNKRKSGEISEEEFKILMKEIIL